MRGFLVQPDSLCLADTGGACTVFRRRRRRRRTNCCRASSSRPSTCFWSPVSRHLLFTTRTPPHVTDGRVDGRRNSRSRPGPPRLEPGSCEPMNPSSLLPSPDRAVDAGREKGPDVWSQCTTTERAARPRPAAFFLPVALHTPSFDLVIRRGQPIYLPVCRPATWTGGYATLSVDASIGH